MKIVRILAASEPQRMELYLSCFYLQIALMSLTWEVPISITDLVLLIGCVFAVLQILLVLFEMCTHTMRAINDVVLGVVFSMFGVDLILSGHTPFGVSFLLITMVILVCAVQSVMLMLKETYRPKATKKFKKAVVKNYGYSVE